MGRHSAPTQEGRPPVAPLRIVAIVLLAVLGTAVVSTVAVTLGGGDDVSRTQPARTATQSAETAAEGSGGTGGAGGSDGSAAASGGQATGTPPAFAFRVLTKSYITVRVPGERTLVSRLFRKGEARQFAKAPLEIVVGNSAGVRIKVHGEPRAPGRSGEVEQFTVHRR